MRPLSSEAVTGYPRWQGELSAAPRIWTMMLHEIRAAYHDQWGRSAMILAFGYALITTAQITFIGQDRPSVHTYDPFLDLLGLLRWAALAIAAIMAGTALLDDAKKGALELYLSRSVTRWTYLAGKVLAVLLMTFVLVFGPALIYVGASYAFFEEHPDRWEWVLLGTAGYAAIWAVVVTGLGLGISCLVRSSRSASILLFAGVAGVDLVLGRVLSGITRSDTIRVVSPMSMLDQQLPWLMGTEATFSWPWWWGLIGLGLLAVIGWALVWRRHPRIRGVD